MSQIFNDACVLAKRLDEALFDRTHPVSTAFMAAAILAMDLEFTRNECNIMFETVMRDLDRIQHRV